MAKDERRPRRVGVLVGVLAAVLAALALAAALWLRQPAGARLVQVECYRCHRPSEVHDARKDRRGWESTVRRMEAHGMDVTPEERETIVEWLAETQPLE